MCHELSRHDRLGWLPLSSGICSTPVRVLRLHRSVDTRIHITIRVPRVTLDQRINANLMKRRCDAARLRSHRRDTTASKPTFRLGPRRVPPTQAIENMTENAIQFDELVKRCLGNLSFAQRVISKFTSRLEDDIDELKEAMQKESLPDVARLAHRLKGASANVAAEGLRRLAEEIEHQARAGLNCTPDSWFPRLEYEIERLLTAAETGLVESSQQETPSPTQPSNSAHH